MRRARPEIVNKIKKLKADNKELFDYAAEKQEEIRKPGSFSEEYTYRRDNKYDDQDRMIYKKDRDDSQIIYLYSDKGMLTVLMYFYGESTYETYSEKEEGKVTVLCRRDTLKNGDKRWYSVQRITYCPPKHRIRA